MTRLTAVRMRYSACALCRSVLTAAQLLSEGISGQQSSGFAAGFDWAAEQLRQAGFEQLEAEVGHEGPAAAGCWLLDEPVIGQGSSSPAVGAPSSVTGTTASHSLDRHVGLVILHKLVVPFVSPQLDITLAMGRAAAMCCFERHYICQAPEASMYCTACLPVDL